MGSVEGKTRRRNDCDDCHLLSRTNHGIDPPELFRELSREHVRLGPHQWRQPRQPRGRDVSIINEARMGRCDKQHWRSLTWPKSCSQARRLARYGLGNFCACVQKTSKPSVTVSRGRW
jgi:hypothetical protein